MKKKTRFLILHESDYEVIVVVDYGDDSACLCTTYSCEDGDGYIRTEYHQERFNGRFRDMDSLYTHLSEGKIYSKDWNGSEEYSPLKGKVDEQVIDDAIAWLEISPGKIIKTVKKEGEYKDTASAIKNFLNSSA